MCVNNCGGEKDNSSETISQEVVLTRNKREEKRGEGFNPLHHWSSSEVSNNESQCLYGNKSIITLCVMSVYERVPLYELGVIRT